MKLIRKLSLILCMILLAQLLCFVSSADDAAFDVSVTNGCRGIDSRVPYLGTANKIENAQAAFMLEANTDTLMYAQNADQQLHPAGLVKIMTALVAIEQGTLTDVVTINESVLSSVSSDARTSKLQVDEVFTVEQLLYCVMVEGSNDGAAVLADHVAGSQEEFVSLMNARAQEIGCTNTVFTNVHGLHDPNQLTTARDVARILDTAIENELFRTLFGTTHYTVEATNKSEERNLESSNHMMHEDMYEIYFDERITGGRTGVNNTGLRCIATISKQQGMELICVIMGSESKINDRGIVEKIGGFTETTELLNIGYKNTKTAQILYDGQALKQYSVRDGSANAVVCSSQNISTVVPSDATAASFEFRYREQPDAFVAPLQAGQYVADVEIWIGSICVAQAKLYAMGDVDVSYKQIIRKDDKGLSVFAVILIVILSIVLISTAVLFIVRLLNIRKRNVIRKQRHRRKREF